MLDSAYIGTSSTPTDQLYSHHS